MGKRNGSIVKSVAFPCYLAVFHIAFIILLATFGRYRSETKTEVNGLYSMFMDVHSMMFIGFGFLMTFLKRYGYGSVGLNFILAAYVLEWALLVRGWIGAEAGGKGIFTIGLQDLLVADFCAAAVLISFGAVLGKATFSQLIIMASAEVVIQSFNEHIGLHYLKAYDVGESIYVHVFGAYFGLAVAKVFNRNKEYESHKEGSNYHSDLFSMIGTILLWLYWPSFNSAVAVEEGQSRAIINTYLAITASCTTTFVISLLVGKGKLNMVHVQNATLAGGVAVGAIADMPIQPFGAMLVGTVAGIISTLGFQYLTPLLNGFFVHDTCGVHNLHGMPGVISGIASALMAMTATRELFNGNRLYAFYPARAPTLNSAEFNSTLNLAQEFPSGGNGRSAFEQGSYQLAALGVTLGLAIVGGLITGLIMRLPIFEQIEDVDDMFDDGPHWITPEDFALSDVKVHRLNNTEEELLEKRHLNIST